MFGAATPLLRGPTPWRETSGVRRAVAELVALGPLPDERHAEAGTEAPRGAAGRDRPTADDEEAAALAGLFGSDDCYGAASSILHLVETAPA